MQNFLKSIKVVVPLVLALLLLLLENGQQRTRGRRNHILAEGKEVAVLVEDNIIFIDYVVFWQKYISFCLYFFFLQIVCFQQENSHSVQKVSNKVASVL